MSVEPPPTSPHASIIPHSLQTLFKLAENYSRNCLQSHQPGRGGLAWLQTMTFLYAERGQSPPPGQAADLGATPPPLASPYLERDARYRSGFLSPISQGERWRACNLQAGKGARVSERVRGASGMQGKPAAGWFLYLSRRGGRPLSARFSLLGKIKVQSEGDGNYGVES